MMINLFFVVELLPYRHIKYHLHSSLTITYLAKKQSERDTYRGNTIENLGCLLARERSERNYTLVVCLSTNGELALNYTIVK